MHFAEIVINDKLIEVIRPHPSLTRFEREYAASRELSFEEALRIFEALWMEARSLGSVNIDRPLDGIENDIELARTLNRSQSNHRNP